MKWFSGFKSAQRIARDYLKDEEQLRPLQESVGQKINQQQTRLNKALVDLKTLSRLLKAYSSGEYRELSVQTMVAVIAALIYFVNPMDLIPDFLMGFGFLDDMAVLAYVFKQFQEELDHFLTWENNQNSGND